jgi:DNA repair photolyase
MQHTKKLIQTEDGQAVKAQAPVIISASRATDIPAFYGDWFIQRHKKGYIKWQNPFNGKDLYVSLKHARAFVFWTKNPKPFLKHLDYLNEQNLNYYFQFSLNDYDRALEAKVPHLSERIETFKELSRRIGKEKVIWRFDPYILSPKHGVEELLMRTDNIARRLKHYTKKLVFSFADIADYKKVAKNMRTTDYTEFTAKSMQQMAAGLQKLNNNWDFEIAACAEKNDFSSYGIKRNKCIDDDLLIKLFSDDRELMIFLGIEFEEQNLFTSERKIIKNKKLKDKGQREFCGCIKSKDIGQYNTCPHGCIYCYANTSPQKAFENYRRHLQNPMQERITD